MPKTKDTSLRGRNSLVLSMPGKRQALVESGVHYPPLPYPYPSLPCQIEQAKMLG